MLTHVDTLKTSYCYLSLANATFAALRTALPARPPPPVSLQGLLHPEHRVPEEAAIAGWHLPVMFIIIIIIISSSSSSR